MRYIGGYNIQEMMQKDTIAMNAGININLEMRELEYNLVYSKRKTLGICIKAPGIIIVRAPMHLPKEQIEKSLKNKSKWILQKLEYYSKHFQIMPNSIKIKAQKTRWGSCTYKNDLALNYKLIMAPPDVLDYVVVHEMCHMEHKNHSKNFWNRVSSIMPDYKDKRNWLKEHGGKL